MTWVIAVHALVVVDTGRRLGVWYLLLSQAVYFTANALFFMLSGRFNLVEKNAEDWKGFYLRKVRGILLPVLVLFFFRTLYNTWPDFVSPQHVLRLFAQNCLGNFSSCEYWFVFQLLSMLLVTPFLVPVVRYLSKEKKKFLLALGFVWFSLHFVFSNSSIELSYSFLFGGYWFAYLLGSVIEDVTDESHVDIKAILVVLICAFATLFCVLHGFTSGAFDYSPFYLLGYTCLYFLLMRFGARINSTRVERVISFCASHSFTVYMIHMMVLQPLASFAPKMYGWSSIGEHVLLTLVTLAISLSIAILIDTVIIGPTKNAFDSLTRKMLK